MNDGTAPALRTRGLSVRYGGVRAVSDVDLTVEPGRLVGLIGPNGAGKTSAIDAVSGFTPATGQVTVGGHDVSSASPHERARRGLARTWQSVELFEDLTVRENLVVSTGRTSMWRTTREILTGHRPADARIDEVLALLGIDDLADLPADRLTRTRDRKLVGIARALVGRPRVLCLDEPAAGLDIPESAELGRRLRGLAGSGLGLLLVDHDMGLILSNCDSVVVLEFGTVIAAGSPRDVAADPRVVSAYLGRPTDGARAAADPVPEAAR